MRCRTSDVNAACIECGWLNALHQKFIVMGGYDCGRIVENERCGIIDLKRKEI